VNFRVTGRCFMATGLHGKGGTAGGIRTPDLDVRSVAL
jgi:hypothetical protein